MSGSKRLAIACTVSGSTGGAGCPIKLILKKNKSNNSKKTLLENNLISKIINIGSMSDIISKIKKRVSYQDTRFVYLVNYFRKVSTS